MALRLSWEREGRVLRVRRRTASLSEEPGAAAALGLGGADTAGRREGAAPSASSAADEEPLSAPAPPRVRRGENTAIVN